MVASELAEYKKLFLQQQKRIDELMAELKKRDKQNVRKAVDNKKKKKQNKEKGSIAEQYKKQEYTRAKNRGYTISYKDAKIENIVKWNRKKDKEEESYPEIEYESDEEEEDEPRYKVYTSFYGRENKELTSKGKKFKHIAIGNKRFQEIRKSHYFEFATRDDLVKKYPSGTIIHRYINDDPKRDETKQWKAFHRYIEENHERIDFEYN